MRDIVFEEEIIDLPTIVTTIATNNERENIPNTIKVANLDVLVNQDIPVLPPTHMEGPSTHIEVPSHVIDEVPQPPQIEVPLRRSTRDMRSTILENCVVYPQEHEFDIRMECDPISFNQVK